MLDHDEAVLLARLHTMLGLSRPAAELDALAEETAGVLGARHSTTLLVACSAEWVRSQHGPIQESLDAWRRLLDRATQALDEGDQTLTIIRSYYTRQLRYRGNFGDLDRVVALRARQGELARRHRPYQAYITADWLGMDDADLAVALIDRGQFGRFDPLLEAGDADADLGKALDLCRSEEARRTETHGADHPITWKIRFIRLKALVAIAGRDDPQAGEEALALADELVAHHGRHWRRGQRDRIPDPLVRAWLLRAKALIALGRHVSAALQTRLICDLSPGRQGDLDPGCPYLTLARAQAPFAPLDALRAAEQAYKKRCDMYSAQSYKVAEAEQLVSSLRSA